ncbi:hypothetical protein [Pseudofrankia asymbiotica]|uniref:Uncharacterized protein n=1 Tax=Pseudofrankia asymbiotica TaxID=1834516 RepID=A0A1V2I2N8_9ACTN|nr:hypothetical protein [Pseudofrankia asymbiotica]ONH24535.1 hypothetical protein BL253_30045 [Pseudofrankia asymbiotica]
MAWPRAARAALYTATLVMLGLSCGLLAWLAFETRLFLGGLSAQDQVPALAALAGGALTGLGVSFLVRPTTLISATCLMIASATTALGVMGHDAGATAALVPGCVAAFGVGALVPAAPRAAGRTRAAVLGGSMITAVALALIAPLTSAAHGGSPSAWTDAADSAGRPYYTWDARGFGNVPDGATYRDRFLTDPIRLTVFGVVTYLAAIGGVAEASVGRRSRGRGFRARAAGARQAVFAFLVRCGVAFGPVVGNGPVPRARVFRRARSRAARPSPEVISPSEVNEPTEPTAAGQPGESGEVALAGAAGAAGAAPMAPSGLDGSRPAALP